MYHVLELMHGTSSISFCVFPFAAKVVLLVAPLALMLVQLRV
jgi:hypothetical protein